MSLYTKHWIGTQELETVKKIYPNYFAKGNVDVLEIKKAPQKMYFLQLWKKIIAKFILFGTIKIFLKNYMLSFIWLGAKIDLFKK